MDYKKEIENGELLYEEGKIDQAESVFKRVLQEDPENHEALNNLGVINIMRDNSQEAEECFLKSLAVKDDYQAALLNLADLYHKSERWKEAIIQQERHLEIDSSDHNIYNQLSVAYLELGDFEKASDTLEKSLKLNPDQVSVKESLSMITNKTKASRIDVSNNPLNILFVQESPCIRNYKMATALRARGHMVSLGYTKALLSQVYKGLTDDVYNECIKLESYRKLWDISGNYDIIHCHNEPDILACAALAGDTPVVHDTHDLISLRANGDQNLAYFEGLANRGAAGRVYSTPYQMNEAKKLYGINGNSLVYYNYASEPDLPKTFLPKLSDEDGNVHVVYEGGIGGNGHRDFSSLFIELANKDIHIHIYPTFYNQEIAQFFTVYKNIHYYQPLSPKQIMQEMTQYDLGIIPFNLGKGNKRFLDSTIANKLFEYMAAGLPVATSPLQTYIDYFQKNSVGVTFADANELISKLPQLKQISCETDFTTQVYTYEQEIVRLEQFYKQLLDTQSRDTCPPSVATPHSKKMPDDQANKERASHTCYVCRSTQVHQIAKNETFNLLRCQECKVAYIDPMPSEIFLRQWHSETEKKKRWNNDLSNAIEANHKQNADNYERYYKMALESMDLNGREKVLEIGCYSGLLLKRFKDLGCECKGIGLNEGFVKYGREVLGLDLEHGQLTDFTFPAESFDIILFHQLLEHLRDPGAFLEEIARLLKPGGYIELSVPDAETELKLDFPNHLFYFSRNSLMRLIEKAGFEDVTPHRNNEQPGLLVVARKSHRTATIPPALITRRTSRRPLLDLDETQWLSTAELENIQNAFLQMLVREVYKKVPFYARLMDERGVKPGAVQSIADLRNMPIIDKDTIHEHYADMRHVDFERLEKHFTGTGGSTGKTLKYFVSPEVYYYGFGCRNRGFSWAGFDENKDRIAYLAGGSLGVTDKVEIEGNKIKVPATGITDRAVVEKYYEALKSFMPDYMRAFPSALFEFCKFLQDEGKTLHLKTVVTTAEMLYDYQRSFIEDTLGCKIFNEYGAYDGGAGAFECEKHFGLHLQMERGIIELLDENGNNVKPGQTGRVIVTDLHNYILPFIRYDVGDMAIASDRVCKCGRGLKLIEGIEGRATDYLILGDGTRISGVSVVHLFNKLLHSGKIDIRQYQVVQKVDRSIIIKIIPGKMYGEEDKSLIQNTVGKHLKGLSVKTENVHRIVPTPAGKMRFVLSEIETNQVDTNQITIHSKREKPKICHIGGAHSVHVSDIVEELDKRGYEQCVISYYPLETAITPKHIPVYHFPYRSYEHPDWERLKLEEKLEQFLGTVFKKEYPDIVHGHSLTYSCIPVRMAKEKFGKPTVLMPWSIHTIKRPNKIANYYEKRCIETLDYFMHPMPNVFKLFQSYYGNLSDEKLVLFRTLIDLSQHDKARAVSKDPKILSARVMGEQYRQDLLIRALPSVTNEFPNTKVTLIIGQVPEQGKNYFENMIQLAKSLGVDRYCNFISTSLSQQEFAELIKSHNIIYSMSTHDEGFSATTIQAVYSGAIVIVRNIPEIDGIFEHNINVLRTEVNEKSLRESLLYAVRNIELLQERFIVENKKFRIYGKEDMLKNLIKCYEKIVLTKPINTLSDNQDHFILKCERLGT